MSQLRVFARIRHHMQENCVDNGIFSRNLIAIEPWHAARVLVAYSFPCMPPANSLLLGVTPLVFNWDIAPPEMFPPCPYDFTCNIACLQMSHWKTWHLSWRRSQSFTAPTGPRRRKSTAPWYACYSFHNSIPPCSRSLPLAPALQTLPQLLPLPAMLLG